MANDFSATTKANISNNSGSPTTLYQPFSAQVDVIIGFFIINKTSSAVNVTLNVTNSFSTDDNIELANSLPIAANSVYELTLGKMVIVDDGPNGTMAITGHASAASAIDVYINSLRDVNS